VRLVRGYLSRATFLINSREKVAQLAHSLRSQADTLKHLAWEDIAVLLLDHRICSTAIAPLKIRVADLVRDHPRERVDGKILLRELGRVQKLLNRPSVNKDMKLTSIGRKYVGVNRFLINKVNHYLLRRDILYLLRDGPDHSTDDL
jgi:hypothetical protein